MFTLDTRLKITAGLTQAAAFARGEVEARTTTFDRTATGVRARAPETAAKAARTQTARSSSRSS